MTLQTDTRAGREIAIGSDGMLFHRFDWAFEQVCGDMPFSAEQKNRWISLLGRREAACRAIGARFVPLIVPERHAVYPERLPEGARPNPERPAMRLRRVAHARGIAAPLYPLDALRATSRFEQTFHLTDQHMTDAGAYACYRALLDHCPDAFRTPALLPDRLTRSASRLLGDLGIRLDQEADEAVTYLRVCAPQARKIATTRLPVGRIDVYQHADRSLPKAVWFGDSHSFTLLPFIAEHFSRLVAVQTTRFLDDLVEAETPDLVVSQISETQLAYPASPDRPDIVRLPDDGRTDGLAELYATGALDAERQTFLSISFGIDGNSHNHCGHGWSASEPTQRWTEGASSSIRLPLPPGDGAWAIDIEAHAFVVATRHERQRLAVVCQQKTLAAFELNGDLHGSIPLDADMLAAASADGHFVLEFLHPDAASPADFGGSDSRRLAICFRQLSIRAG